MTIEEMVEELRVLSDSRRHFTKRRLHSWSFAQFHSFLSYKRENARYAAAKADRQKVVVLPTQPIVSPVAEDACQAIAEAVRIVASPKVIEMSAQSVISKVDSAPKRRDMLNAHLNGNKGFSLLRV
jgi:hypothetical protein